MNTPLHDEAHALPTEETIAVGAGIHQIVAHESGVADTVDPFAGMTGDNPGKLQNLVVADREL